MAVLPAARILLDFSIEPGSDAFPTQQIQRPSQPCQRCNKVEDIQTAIAEAHKQGVAEGLEYGRSERLHTEAEIEASLRAEREVRMNALSRELLTRIDCGLAQICTEITNSTTLLFKTFFQNRIRQETIDELAQTLGETLNAHSQPKIMIRGPQELVDHVRSLLPPDQLPHIVELRLDTVVDVQITVDHTSVETGIESWLSRMEAVR